jgi:hypothetical protein
MTVQLNGQTEVDKDIDYTEEHLHHKTRWYGIRSPQTETQWADALSMLPFVAISGLNTWGADLNDEVQCFGAGDVLAELGTGLVCGDFDLILVTTNSSATLSRLRLIWGTGTMADAITANQYTDLLYSRTNSDTTRIPRQFASPRLTIDNKIWMQHWNASNNATISFYLGVHAYNF